MFKRLLTGLSLFILIVALGTAVIAADTPKAEESKHEFVGVKKCKLCHKKDGVYESWLHTKHAFAYDSLSAEDQKNEALLPYYTTGTTAKGVLLTGVQCEACHGAGSDFKKKKIMSDPELSAKNGLIMPDSAACVKCHHKDAPAALAALAEGFDLAKLREKGVHGVAEAAKAKKQ